MALRATGNIENIAVSAHCCRWSQHLNAAVVARVADVRCIHEIGGWSNSQFADKASIKFPLCRTDAKKHRQLTQNERLFSKEPATSFHLLASHFRRLHCPVSQTVLC